METKYWTVPLSVDAENASIQEAAHLIQAGKLVSFPTETVYGLGADAQCTSAVERIFSAKGRPNDNPLIVHIANRAQLEGVVDTSNTLVQRLMEDFWPGPLAIVLPLLPNSSISPAVTAGLSTLAVRMPDHPVALSLIEAANCLVAAPSANRSGRPSPTTAEHVREDLHGDIEGVLDGGPTGVGLESTVIEVIDKRIHILRPGGITEEQLRTVTQQVETETMNDEVEAPRSPGMKYTHYAPKGKLTLVKGDSHDAVVAWIQEELSKAKREGYKTGVLTYVERVDCYTADCVIACGSWSRPEEAAHKLYDALRQFDREDIDFILAEACFEEGVGKAVMNRLMRAAGDRVVLIS